MQIGILKRIIPDLEFRHKKLLYYKQNDYLAPNHKSAAAPNQLAVKRIRMSEVKL